jgi:hypothetical protein
VNSGFCGSSPRALADEADRFGERGLADVRVLPRNIYQRLLRDDAAGALDEMLKDGQRAAAADLLSSASAARLKGRAGTGRSRRPIVCWDENQRSRRIVLLHH